MLRSLALLLLLAEGPPPCVLVDAAHAREQAAHDAAEQAFAAAVKKRGLSLVTLPVSVVQGTYNDRFAAEGERRGGGVAMQMIPVPCGSKPPSYQFGRDAKGRIFLLQRAPRTRDEAVAVCGCPEYPPGCGPAPRPTQVWVELPRGTTYAGAVRIDYEATAVRLDYSGGRACPPPPPAVP